MRNAMGVIAIMLWCSTSTARTVGAAGAVDSTKAMARTAGKRPPLAAPKVSGYIQIHYRQAFATGVDSLVDNNDFRVQRVRIGVHGEISPKVGYDIEIDPRAPEITGVLRDAYVTLRHLPRHEVRIGQQKTQFGYENRESSTDLFAVNRAELSDAISRGQTLRDIGVGLIGNVKLGKGLRLEDAITVVNGAGMNVQADDTPRKNIWGRLGLRYRNDARDIVARLGASGGSGDFIDPGDDPLDSADDFRVVFARTGADVELDCRAFFFSAEYASARDENKLTAELDEPKGFYVNLAGKIANRFGPIVRYDEFDDVFKRWTLGAYVGLPSEPLRTMVNYEIRKAKDGVRSDDKLYLWMQVRF